MSLAAITDAAVAGTGSQMVKWVRRNRSLNVESGPDTIGCTPRQFDTQGFPQGAPVVLLLKVIYQTSSGPPYSQFSQVPVTCVAGLCWVTHRSPANEDSGLVFLWVPWRRQSRLRCASGTHTLLLPASDLSFLLIRKSTGLSFRSA